MDLCFAIIYLEIFFFLSFCSFSFAKHCHFRIRCRMFFSIILNHVSYARGCWQSRRETTVKRDVIPDLLPICFCEASPSLNKARTRKKFAFAFFSSFFFFDLRICLKKCIFAVWIKMNFAMISTKTSEANLKKEFCFSIIFSFFRSLDL